MFSVGARAAKLQPGTAQLDREILEYIGSGQHTPRPIAPLPPMSANSWLGALMVTNEGTSHERFFGYVYKNPGDGFSARSHHHRSIRHREDGVVVGYLAVWDDEKQQLRVDQRSEGLPVWGSNVTLAGPYSTDFTPNS